MVKRIGPWAPLTPRQEAGLYDDMHKYLLNRQADWALAAEQTRPYTGATSGRCEELPGDFGE